MMHVTICSPKAGLHYQSFCDHSRNFAWVNSEGLLEGTDLVLFKTLSQYPQTFLTNPSNLTIYLCNFGSVNQPLATI
jgi:hypothetical protein